MMNTTSITTRTFALEKGAFFKLLMSLFIKRMWWIILVILTVVLANIWKERDDLELMFFTVGIVLLFSVGSSVYSVWRYVNRKENEIFYISKYYVIDDEKISGFSEDGSTSSYNIKNLFRARLVLDHYFVHVSRMQQIIIPVTAFKTLEDRAWFDSHVVDKVKSLRGKKKLAGA